MSRFRVVYLIMPKVKDEGNGMFSFYCPGCGHNHVYFIAGHGHRLEWNFNGDVNNPTFSPSLLNRTGSYAEPTYIDPPEIPPTICHLFVTEGKIIYCGDCTHHLSGQTFQLPEIEL